MGFTVHPKKVESHMYCVYFLPVFPSDEVKPAGFKLLRKVWSKPPTVGEGGCVL